MPSELFPGIGEAPHPTSECVDTSEQCSTTTVARVAASAVRTLLLLCCVRQEVASFLKHGETKRKRAVCSPVIVAPAPVPPAEWQLPATSYARAQSRSSPWVP